MLNKRIANKNDYKLVLEIWEKSVKQTHDFLAEADFNFYKAIIPENLDEVKLYLWEDNGEIVGFIGKRYGSQILIELIETEDIKRIDVNSQNKYAKHFYLSHGFEIESEEDLDGFGKPYPITHLVKK